MKGDWRQKEKIAEKVEAREAGRGGLFYSKN